LAGDKCYNMIPLTFKYYKTSFFTIGEKTYEDWHDQLVMSITQVYYRLN
jgi:hypothetical protein